MEDQSNPQPTGTNSADIRQRGTVPAIIAETRAMLCQVEAKLDDIDIEIACYTRKRKQDKAATNSRMINDWLQKMPGTYISGSLNPREVITHTITGLKRWSCHAKELPPFSKVKALHVYDFDNTLFMSPLPNQKLWNQNTVGKLQMQKPFGTVGGWWHDEKILAATGEGIDVEEPRAWEGCWNETIVDLVQLSAEQNDALTVLLTGRGEHNFAELIKRMVSSKNLDFDIICLKPEVGPNNQRFESTMKFKQAFLEDLVLTYYDAEEIRIYEDRPKHTRVFRDWFLDLNRRILSASTSASRKPIMTEVVQVTDQAATLNPIIEAAEVQRMINDHNTQLPPSVRPLVIQPRVRYTGYLVFPADTSRLLSLVKVPASMNENDIKYMGTNIMIAPRQVDETTLTKVGGLGNKQTWQVTGLSFFNSSIWAARVTPVPNVSVVITNTNTPLIVLATYKAALPADANRIQNWQSVDMDKQYIIQTTVGEKTELCIETGSEDNESDKSDRKNLKRQHSPPHGQNQSQRNGQHHDENKRPNGGNAGFRGGNQNRGRVGASTGGRSSNQNNNRTARGGGNNRGGGVSGRRQGQRGGYKSLDDMGPGNGRYNTQRGEPNYDDYVPGGGGYDAAFPTTKGTGFDGAGGLPYGK